MGIGTIFNVILVNPTINFLLLFLFIFTTWNIPGAFGWAIISLTIAIRLLLNPLFAKQMKTARDIEMLRPKLAASMTNIKMTSSDFSKNSLSYIKNMVLIQLQAV